MAPPCNLSISNFSPILESTQAAKISPLIPKAAPDASAPIQETVVHFPSMSMPRVYTSEHFASPHWDSIVHPVSLNFMVNSRILPVFVFLLTVLKHPGPTFVVILLSKTFHSALT